MISAADSNEIFNFVSHLAGAVFAAGGAAVLIILSALQGKLMHVVSFAIYGTTLFLCFLASAIMHGNLAAGRYRRALGILDHDAIYLLIAGTYTPFALIVIGDALGWAVFGIVWALAAASIAIKSALFRKLGTLFSAASYLTLGWLCLPFALEIYGKLGLPAVALMGAGGLLFTAGAAIFFTGKPNPFPPVFGSHEIWHVFVLAGSTAFYLTFLLFVLPLA